MNEAKQVGRGLVADIGGTNSRFAVAADGAISEPVKFACADFQDMKAAIEAYLEFSSVEASDLNWAVLAVAGPVDGDEVHMTNHAWRIKGSEIADAFGWTRASVVNDFTALACSTPALTREHLKPLGGGSARANAGIITTAIVGAGTGLGVGGLVRGAFGVAPLTTEGGHTSFAPLDDIERAVNAALLTRFERVSNERLLSGPGLVNLYWALGQAAGVQTDEIEPAEVTARAIAGSDQLAVDTIAMFARMLGAFTGDLVLSYGARGGAYIAGGLVPAMRDIFDGAAFRARFEAKGRFREYMESVPVWLVTDPFAALTGAAVFGAAVWGAEP